jgi:hypothetical protein
MLTLPTKQKYRRPLSAEAGFTLVEVSIAAVLGAAIAALFLSVQADNLHNQVAQNQGQLLSTINNSVNGYLAANYTALVNHTAIPGVVNPYAPTLAELSSLGFLSTPYSAQNLYGGSYAVSLSLVPSGCISINCNVGGLVALTTPVLDNQGRVDISAAGAAMLAAGGDAGMSSSTSPGVITGAGGSWTATNPVGSVAGVVAMRNGYLSSSFASFVRRDGSLSMTGNLNLGSNSITNTNTVSAGTVSATTVNASAVGSNSVSTTTLSASSIGANSTNTGTLAATTASLSSVTSGNISNSGTVSTNAVSSNTVNSTGRIATSEYLQVSGYAPVGGWCSTPGLVAQDGSGGLLSCVNNQWSRFQTFMNIPTTEGTVDWYCGQGDPNPPGYNYAQWAIVCGSRFCQRAYNYGFGLIVESPGSDSTKPFESDPGGSVTVACSR